ncbi:putative transposon-derived Buster3 transposase-like protein-like [Apostichopus japonicus]|uniref:Putative transposon-derived Buster3 transposase-like protein-like n=1 Tax=Stichopus japonicus TaxID=307972 RepID=A0A2G8KSG0_STIJA|nr:putative transposon-derived Buster3 transposase-like protein-like [Apostichopus japonicus]
MTSSLMASGVWKADEDTRLFKLIEEGTTEELAEHICSLLLQFLQHCYMKRHQASSYNTEGKVDNHCFVLFPRLSAHIKESEGIEVETLSVDNALHIQSLISQFDKYFPELDVPSFAVAQDPFTAPLDAVAEDDIIEEELVRMKQDSEAKTVYQSFSLQEFWNRILKSYLMCHKWQCGFLCQYPTSYICEQSFSTMVDENEVGIDCQ